MFCKERQYEGFEWYLETAIQGTTLKIVLLDLSLGILAHPTNISESHPGEASCNPDGPDHLAHPLALHCHPSQLCPCTLLLQQCLRNSNQVPCCPEHQARTFVGAVCQLQDLQCLHLQGVSV